ncbi:MAG: hypothetical protein ACE15F_16005 [bacterium]
MKAFFYFVGGMAAVSVLAWFLLTFVLVSDEERIHRLIEKGCRGVESGSLFILGNLLATDYQHEGGMSRAEVLGGLRSLFEDTTGRRVRVLRNEVKVEDGRAEAEITFLFSARSRIPNAVHQELLNQAGRDKSIVRVELVKDGRSWKITRTAFRHSP